MSCRLLQPLTYENFYVYFLSCEMCRGKVNATSRGYYIMSGACSLHEPTIEVRWPRPHAALVVLGGEHDLNSADQLRETFNQSLAHCDHLIVDLSATEFIDASTIGVLMEARQHAIELDRTFSVVLGTEADRRTTPRGERRSSAVGCRSDSRTSTRCSGDQRGVVEFALGRHHMGVRPGSRHHFAVPTSSPIRAGTAAPMSPHL